MTHRTLSKPQLSALQYVANTNGGATKAHFLDDHDPIGSLLWDQLSQAELVTEIDSRIYPTEAGKALLNQAS